MTTIWHARRKAPIGGCSGSGYQSLVLCKDSGREIARVEYAELLCLTNFSFQLGASHPRELVERAKELGYEALAIADECSLAGIVRAHEAAETVGLPLIVGSQFRFEEGDRVALLAPTQDAYSQICELISQSRAPRPRAPTASAARTLKAARYRKRSPFGYRVDRSHLQTVEWFARLPVVTAYLAHAHHLQQDSAQRLDTLLAYGQQFELSLTAVGDVHYHVRDRRPLHDVLTAIRLKTTVDKIGRKGFANGERHLRPLSTLSKLYPLSCSQPRWRSRDAALSP